MACLWETPPASLVPTGNHEATSSTFSTFQPMNLTQGRCQNLSCGSRPSMQVMKEQGVQLSPRTNHTVVSRNLGGCSCLIHHHPLEDEGVHMNPCQNASWGPEAGSGEFLPPVHSYPLVLSFSGPEKSQAQSSGDQDTVH